MSRSAVLLAFLFFSVVLPCWAQQPVSLDDCQAQLAKWQEWADKNVPVHEELMQHVAYLESENKRLDTENSKFRENSSLAFERFSGFGVGVAAALFAFWILVQIFKAVRRVWPLTPVGRQLGSLVCGATWIVVVSVIAWFTSDGEPSLVGLGMAYLPGILFSGIAFWWYEKHKPERRKIGI